jgi:signal transduction histidine kinase
MSLRVRRSTAAWGAFVIVCATTAAFALSRSGAQATAIVSVDLGLVFVLAVAAFAREQQRLLAELREAEQARAQAAVLQERARLAREIHDVLAHSLTGLSVQLQGARLLLARDHPDHAALAQVERAEALARSGLEETRRAVGALRGDAMPGPEQLAALAEDFERDTGIPCRCEVSGQARPLAAEAGLAVYRTAQEALSNVRKHAAGAAEVVLRLRWSAGAAELTVADRVAGGMAQGNGSRGAASLAGTGGGYGLTGIRERAELLGGSLDAGPRDGGFAVCLRLPA